MFNISQPNGADIFNTENIKECDKYVCSIQRKLDKAVANNDKDKIRWYSHILLKKSRAVKILAVHQVTANEGCKTAGIDGVRVFRKEDFLKVPKSKQEIRNLNLELKIELLNNIDIKKKPSPIRRVFIPKPNGKMRPLGIPTLTDRIIQDILRMTLEPITEYHANECSYGFRPKRSCQDAIASLFTKLSTKRSPKWIVEGDIKGCFDNISHEHITNTLLEWKVQENIVKIIERMLKSEIFHNNEYELSETGFFKEAQAVTPQGGILSPMLANVALTASDDYCEKNFGCTRSQTIKQEGIRSIPLLDMQMIL